MTKNDMYKLDYLILASILDSQETEKDIVLMVQRFITMRFQCELSFPLNIQNPPSETKKEI